MTTTLRHGASAAHGNDNRHGGFSVGLRPADAVRSASRLAAGPFDVSADKRGGSLSEALVTGLLVVYPAFATVAAIVVGLFLSTPVGGA